MRCNLKNTRNLPTATLLKKTSLPFQKLPGDPQGGMGPREFLTSSDPQLPINP